VIVKVAGNHYSIEFVLLTDYGQRESQKDARISQQPEQSPRHREKARNPDIRVRPSPNPKHLNEESALESFRLPWCVPGGRIQMNTCDSL
jgi:hypothetical protein